MILLVCARRKTENKTLFTQNQRHKYFFRFELLILISDSNVNEERLRFLQQSFCKLKQRMIDVILFYPNAGGIGQAVLPQPKLPTQNISMFELLSILEMKIL